MLSEKRLKFKLNEKEAYLNALEELDRTGRLKKASYKERFNFTLDSDLMIEFKKYCEENSISMSNKVENLIKGYLRKCKEK